MSLKSIIGKVLNKKSAEADQSLDETEFTQHEISFKDTVIEAVHREEGFAAENEIDIYVHGEKSKIYQVTTETHIGRDPSQVHIAIPELIVSKFHCTLYFLGDNIYIKDNNSTNGTYVNGQKAADRQLEDGDVITLGKKGIVRIIFHKRPVSGPKASDENNRD
jgi:pSer/pThr/pTyr-binding forkhead associated (FHA) protein